MTPSRWSPRALRLLPTLALGLTLAALPARAQTPGSTGVDPTWLVSWTSTVFGSNSGGFFTAVLIASPPGVWQPNTPTYQWIGATSSASLEQRTADGSPNYLYTFRNVFDLALDQAASYSIVFRCARDNSLVSYMLNGVVRGTDCGTGFQFGASQVLAGGFIAGENTLDFMVTGDGTTDGLLVSIDQAPEINVTPEPASMGLMAIGLVGLFGVVRRGRNGSAAV